ncbi:hypothetical protein GIB67_022403 [Kingdonia uniflora]|uniref:Uncharacterized protein n=1 Tax=Kingdonia uniflora TaxID=39325 RepID=A0A7J7MTX4_9MAGN|nr:hypothetical protein GIB67_022403 [Kingdonia uniflora]
MVSSHVNKASTSGRSAESEIKISESKEKVGVNQYSDFPGRLESYPLRSDVFKKFCKAKASLGGRWHSSVEYAGRVNFQWVFLCYLSQLEFGLSIPLSNLAKEIMNLIGAYPIQMNGKMWEVISVCESLNTRWEEDGRRRRISSQDVLQFYGRDDEEPLELLLRTVKQTPKSSVVRKDLLFDIVAQEETELEAVLEELGIRSRAEKVLKSHSTRLITSDDDNKKKGTDRERLVNFPKPLGVDCTRLAALHGEEKMCKMAARLMKGICLVVEDEGAELNRKKVELKRNVAQLKTDLLKEGKWMEALRALQVVEINNLHAEVRVNLVEVVAERDRLGRHLMSKGYSKDKVNAIRGDTYVEEEEDEEIEDVIVGAVDGLDGVSPQTVKDNQGDDNEGPEGETGKDIRLRLKDLEAELAMERDASASLLSSQAELQVELESACLHEGDARQYYVDLARQIEEKDAEIEKGQKELAELKEHVMRLKSQNDALMVKSREADMARYRIQALKKSKEGLNRSMAGLKNDLIKKMNNPEKVPTDLANSWSELERLKKDWLTKITS